MPKQLFRIELSVKSIAGGEAELLLPEVLQDLNYRYIIVKNGGEEAIVEVEAPEAALEKIGKSEGCQRLRPKQMENLQKSYPAPKVKMKYRRSPGTAIESEMFVVDEQGNKVVDNIQTVRSGFYLIDVPILPRLAEE